MDIVGALRTFLRVAQTGSFTAAAADLDLTQPAVSRQVSALEARLGLRLLHRTTVALALTAEGERLIPMALRVIEAVEALGESAGTGEAAVAGKVRLSLPAPLGLALAERLPELLARHPGLSVDLLLREAPSDLVGEGIDLEVRLGAVEDSSLTGRRIGWTTAYLVAAPCYLSRRPAPVRPEEVPLHDCICYARAGDGRQWSFSDGADETRLRITPRLTADSAVAIHRATLAGGGLAILSHILAGPDIAAGRLISLIPDFPPARLPITLVYPSRRNLPQRVKAVMEFVVDAVRADAMMG
ncbi:LysR family transcriptional regulator [Labrys sp. KB_33_2]|uniref:LysR family transcriptional regulator n=1 Tax=Labrys sp. KB_33_2 TaxID=3237479 RepID=UPI003F93B3F1